MNTQFNNRRAGGFSLVELLLALALGLVVVAGIVQLFVSNSRTYETLNAQARLQENARFALEFISQAARSAGFFGCAMDRTNYVNGLGGTWQGTPGGMFDINRISQPGDGRVGFRSMRRPGWRLADVLQPDGNPEITLPAGDPGPEAGDVLVLSNCEQGAVFRLTGVNAAAGEAELLHRPAAAGGCAGSSYVSAGNAQCVVGVDDFTYVPYTLSKLNRSYGAESVVGLFENIEFYVQDGALWQDLNGDADELVAGIEALDLRYGLDTDPNDGDRRADRYVTFADLGPFMPAVPEDPSPIVSLRISVTATEQAAGEEMRRTFSKTVLLRNSNPEA